MQTDGASGNSAGERIQEALAQAYDAKAEFDIAIQLDAAGHDAKPQAQRIRFQSYVLYCVSMLRPYLVGDVPRYWNGIDADDADGEAIYLYDGEGVQLEGLRDLMAYQGAVSESVEWSEGEVHDDRNPDLLPPQALRNALDWLGESAYQLGFMPKANKRRQAYNASAKTDEEANEIFQ